MKMAIMLKRMKSICRRECSALIGQGNLGRALAHRQLHAMYRSSIIRIFIFLKAIKHQVPERVAGYCEPLVQTWMCGVDLSGLALSYAHRIALLIDIYIQQGPPTGTVCTSPGRIALAQ